jgi:predicted nucleic acid-binding protein
MGRDTLREVFCNTSPLQYLHQLDLLPVLQVLAGRLIVPPAVVDELAAGISKGLDLPRLASFEWIDVRAPRSLAAVPLVSDLGTGETQVLALALESSEPLALLDDALARRVAASLGITVEGTLGLLMDAKRAGLLVSVGPLLDQLQSLGFRLDSGTRDAVLRLSGETSHR